MNSAEISRVKEVTTDRMFSVSSGDERSLSLVTYYSEKDSLWCSTCIDSDNCEHSRRVRLSGLITHSVVKNVRTRKKETNAATAAKER